jgi:hypothetical protein
MMRKTQFECEADVQRHFAMIAALSERPQPPADLWESLERTRRVAQKQAGRPVRPARPPDSFCFELVEITRKANRHAIKEVNSVEPVSHESTHRTRVPAVTPAPLTLVSRVNSKQRHRR